MNWQDYSAKVSDFGLAVDGPQGVDAHVTTSVMGTEGYAAPEYITTGIYYKLRIHSFCNFDLSCNMRKH